MTQVIDTDGGIRDVEPSMYGVRDPLGTPTAVALEIDPLAPWGVFIDSVHHQIHEGEQFNYTEVITLGSAATQDYLLIVPAGDYPHLSYSIEGLYGITVELFEATDKTQSAAAVTSFNRNRNSTKTPDMTIKKGTDAGSTDGTRILWRKAGSGTSQGKLSGTSQDNHERILKVSTNYIFRITSAAASNDINVQFDWYEEGAN